MSHRLLPANGSVIVFMLVRRPDGGPTGYPMTGLFVDGALRMTTYRKSAKARYLLADGRVCCVVPDPAMAASNASSPRPTAPGIRTNRRRRGSPVPPSASTTTCGWPS